MAVLLTTGVCGVGGGDLLRLSSLGGESTTNGGGGGGGGGKVVLGGYTKQLATCW